MNIFYKDGEIATRNLSPGIRVYDERLIQDGEEEYRIWNPRRSKLAAALLNGLEGLDLYNDSKVLYLGASTGTTVSHISDISLGKFVANKRESQIEIRFANGILC